jgi:Tol biopolymer transport system component
MRLLMSGLLAVCLVGLVPGAANGRPGSREFLTFNVVGLDGHKRVLSRHNFVPETSSLSPNHTQFAYAPYVSDGVKSDELWVADVYSPRERLVARMPAWIVAVAWSPSDIGIAVSVLSPPPTSGADGIWLIPANGLEPRRLTKFAGPIVWAPDGRRLAFMRWDGGTWQLGVLDIETGVITTLGEGQNPAWAPGGRQLVYEKVLGCTCLPEIRVVSMVTGRSRRLLRGLSPSWSPNGRFVAFHRGSRNSLWVVSSRGGRPRFLAERASTGLWSNKSRWVAFARRVANARTCRTSLNVVSIHGGQIRRLAVETRVIAPAMWTISGRGRLIYSATRCFS